MPGTFKIFPKAQPRSMNFKRCKAFLERFEGGECLRRRDFVLDRNMGVITLLILPAQRKLKTATQMSPQSQELCRWGIVRHAVA